MVLPRLFTPRRGGKMAQGRRSARKPVGGLFFALVSVGLVVFLGIPSSRALAGASPGEPQEGLYLVDPTAASPTLVTAGEKDDPSWSPDGRWLVALDSEDYYEEAIDVTTGARHRAGSLSWSHDGSRLAYTPSRGSGSKLLV